MVSGHFDLRHLGNSGLRDALSSGAQATVTLDILATLGSDMPCENNDDDYKHDDDDDDADDDNDDDDDDVLTTLGSETP